MSSLFLLFNHRLTPNQDQDARVALGVHEIIDLPPNLKELWSQVPTDLSEFGSYLAPIKNWLADRAEESDYVLIQGDFGACFIMVTFAFQRGLIPVYSTTERHALEKHSVDGSVELNHVFRHQAFRRYGV